MESFKYGDKIKIVKDFIFPINGKDVNLNGLEVVINSVIHFKPKRYRQRHQESFTYNLKLPDRNILTCGEDALLYLMGKDNE